MTDNAKGGVLVGGSLTAEVIESSESVLRTRGMAGMSGLQQFYSPPEMASLVGKIVGNLEVIDLTAGDGSLMARCASDRRYGIEIDADQIANSKSDNQDYEAMHGDVQSLAPLLIEMGAEWPAIVLNPPYGLKWQDPLVNNGHPVNSCRLAYEYAAKMLGYAGTMVMLCGGEGRYENIKEHLTATRGPRTLKPYAVLHVTDMFDDVVTPTDVVFLGWESMNNSIDHVQMMNVMREQLDSDLIVDAIKKLRQDKTRFRGWATGDPERMKMWVRGAQAEHDRRQGKKLKRKNDYDLYGNKKSVVVHLRPFTSLALAQKSQQTLRLLNSYNRQPLEYFVLNAKAWDKLLEMQQDETIFIEPALIDRVAKMQLDRQRDIVPMYELKPQQRLAYLEDLEKVLCVKTHTYNNQEFREGEEYAISVQSVISQKKEKGRPVVNKKTGDVVLKDFVTERKLLQIRIAGSLFSETKTDIEHIIEHYAIPDPGTVADRYPEETERNRLLLDSYCEGKDWQYKPFQREDIARLLVKGSGLLAWEQGLGKTLAGMTFAQGCVDLFGAQEAVLIVVPQDLIPQWRREVKRFFGKELTWLKNGQDFRDCKASLKAGGKGWYITHYEALSRTGGGKTPKGNVSMTEEITPEGSMRSFVRIRDVREGGDWYYDDDGNLQKRPIKVVTQRETLDDATHCPWCTTSHLHGYNPQRGCGKCGWSRYSRRVKANYDTIKSSFRHGILVIDELTKIKGDGAARSKCIRGIKAKHILGMTGTPIKNYIPDSFWGLWKSLGDASPRFPYAYQGGKTKYENDFAVVEYQMSGYRKEARRILPEVTNTSKLWRLLSASIIRRRKEETGETLVKRTFYPTSVPLGVNQRAAAERWLNSFADFFAMKNPTHKIVLKKMHEMMAAMLGQLWKLEFAATLPQADPDSDFWVKDGPYKELREAYEAHIEADGAPRIAEYSEDKLIDPVSNWTPAVTRVMELAMHHTSVGDRVLIGSDIVLPGKFLVDELSKRGVKVGNVLTEGEGDPKTKSPAARAKIVQEFQTGKINCLVATCEALNLGHNLDAGNVVIVNGLPWDYATFDQFIARIHRLTSKKDVKVYVIVPRGTLTERKWKLLVDKGAAANLALDGRLIEADEQHIDQATILKELVEAGLPVQGTEIAESDMQKRWEGIHNVEDLGKIVLEGAGVEDLHQLTEAEVEEAAETKQATLDEERNPLPEEPTEPVEPAATYVEHECYAHACRKEAAGHKAFGVDSDGDRYCSSECWYSIWGDDTPPLEGWGALKPEGHIIGALAADVTSDPVVSVTPDPNAYDQPIGPALADLEPEDDGEVEEIEHEIDHTYEDDTPDQPEPEPAVDNPPYSDPEPEPETRFTPEIMAAAADEALKQVPDETPDPDPAGGLGWF